MTLLPPRPARPAVLLAAAMALGGHAQALTIDTTFDPSITGLADASTIESAFNTITAEYESVLASPITVNVDVSWGSVDGMALAPGAVSQSVDEIYGVSSYATLKSYLSAQAVANPTDTALATAVANLPASTPAGLSNYVVPSAEAKALGLISATQTAYDGYIGFNSGFAYDFNPSNGIAAGTYEFEAAAAHEMDEVLGRISGLATPSPTYRTVFDLYRYSAPGVLSFDYDTPAYLSVDGGATNLGDFNASPSGGDRGDWANSGATATNVQNAFLGPGKAYDLTAADLTGLDALGYVGSNIGDTDLNAPTTIADAFGAAAAVPEPGAWAMLLLGVGGIGAALRRKPARAPA